MSNLQIAFDLNNSGSYVKSIGIIFKDVLPLIKNSDYLLIDSYISDFLKLGFSTKVGIGLLTITKSIQENLPIRKELLEYTKKELEKDYTEDEAIQLLKGF